MNYSKLYNIDFKKLGSRLTPPFLRGVKFSDWLGVVLGGLIPVNTIFKKYREEAIYKVTHNGQVVYLQKVLNDSFDEVLRRIYIQDAIYYEPVWIYPQASERPVYIYESSPVYIYSQENYNDSDTDFEVIMPLATKPSDQLELSKLESKIKSLVNYYKLASKTYVIKWI